LQEDFSMTYKNKFELAFAAYPDCWTPVERAMFATGDFIQAFVKDRPFPSSRRLEAGVWQTQLRGKISRRAFRKVCNNLRRGWSPIGDD